MTTTSTHSQAFDPAKVSPPDHLLRGSEVQARTQIGKTKRSELIRKGEFPQPIKVCGGCTNFWLASEVDQWLQKQVQQHRTHLAAIASNPLNVWLSEAVQRTKQAKASQQQEPGHA